MYRRLALVHENLIGAQFPTGRAADKGVDVKALLEWMKANKVDICFCGDIHRPQAIRSDTGILAWTNDLHKGGYQVVIVGAPYQMDFGDEYQKRGVWLFETGRDGDKSQFVEYPGGPLFITITDTGMEDWKLGMGRDEGSNVFPRFQLAEDANLDWVRSHADEIGPCRIEPLPKDTNLQSRQHVVSDPGRLVQAIREGSAGGRGTGQGKADVHRASVFREGYSGGVREWMDGLTSRTSCPRGTRSLKCCTLGTTGKRCTS